MANSVRCAYCDGAFPPGQIPAFCFYCRHALTGATCRWCGRAGGADLVDGICHRCLAVHSSTPPTPSADPSPRAQPPQLVPAAPNAPGRNMDFCKSCGSAKDKDSWTCPYCGYTQWDDIVVAGFAAIFCVVIAVIGYFQSDPLTHNLALWGGLIGALLFGIACISELVSKASRRQGHREPTWQPRYPTVPSAPTSSQQSTSQTEFKYNGRDRAASGETHGEADYYGGARVSPPQAQSANAPPVSREWAQPEDLLASLPDSIRSYLRVALLPVTEDRELADGSGFGGVPHLPAGSEHPACPRCGQPLSQFLQLRLEDLPEDNRPAGEGLLQLFYCTTEGDEDGACEFELEAYSEFSQATVIRLVPAGFGHPSAVSPRFPPKRIVDWTRQPEPPDWCEMGFRGLRVDEDLAEALSEAGLPTSNDKLGGWPSWVQDVRYVECRKCHERMRYLFQVASEDHLDYMFGDVGTAWLCQCQTHPDEMAFYWDCS